MALTRSSKHETKFRYCYPLLATIAIRILGALWLYHLFSANGAFHTAWMTSYQTLTLGWSSIPVPSGTASWLWLFNAYDSLHFTQIAVLGYAHPNYVYLPAYPIFIRSVGLLIGDYWLAAFLITQTFAFGSIVVFQLLAEEYMTRREALHATLLMTMFPYVALFTVFSYSEAIFLFFSIGAWYFYKQERLGASVALAAFASVTRIYGLAIVVPMVLNIVKSKEYRTLLYLTIPVMFAGSWLLFGYFSTGNPWVSWTDEKYWVFDSKFSLMQTILLQSIQGVIACCAVDSSILVAVALFVVLIASVWRLDRYLWTYVAVLFVLLVSTTVDHLSLLRYFSFLFPVWLTVKVKNSLTVAFCIGVFIPVMLVLWTYVLSAIFIG